MTGEQKVKRTRSRRRDSNKSVLSSTGLPVSSDRSKRTTAQSGPVERVPNIKMEHAKKLKLSARRGDKTLDAFGMKTGKRAVEGYLNGTDIAEFAVAEDFATIVAFAQGVAITAYKLTPSIFANPTSATTSPQAEIITPTDFVAYCCVAILRAYSKAGQLDSEFAGALDNFSDDFRIPVPIAEYIRHRVKVVGAPCIARRLSYATDWTISTGQIIYNNAASSSVELGYNHWGIETNLNQFEIWPYQVVNGSQNDLVTYSVALNFNLVSNGAGRTSWVSSRMNAVAAYFATTGSFKLNTVPFGQVPLCTMDYSGFAGPENGKTWAETRRALSPGARFNPDLAMYFSPNGFGQYYPGMSYFGVVNPPSAAVQGGSYSNTYGGSGVYFGEPVVPLYLTRVAQVMQTLNHILLSEEGMKQGVFGARGYKYCGLLVSNLNRINYAPIDVAGLTGKMIRAFVVACNSYGQTGLTVPAGFLNALIPLAQGCIIRKILTAGQFEFLISLNTQPTSSGLSNLWNVQALIPSLDYITTELPLPWVNILDAIGPSYYDGALVIPTFGQTMAQSWSAASGAAKYNNFPKFGFISSVAGVYPPNLVPFAASNPNPDLYQFPYVWLSNPIGAPYREGSYWYGLTANAANPSGWNSQATFPTTSASSTLQPSSNAIAPLLRIVALYTYDAAVQSTYASDNSAASGRETHMAFQYAEASSCLTCVAQVFRDNVKTNKGYSIRPVQQSLGNVGMNAVILSTVDNGVNRNFDALNVFIGLDTGGNDATALLSVTMGPGENDVVHSNVFLTNSRIWLVAALGLNTQYLVPATRPQQLSAYTKSGYVTRIVGSNGMSLWTEYCQKCAQEGSEVNKEIQKVLEKPHTMDHHEKMVSTVRASASAKSGAAQGALIDNAIDSQFTYGSTAFDVGTIERAFAEAKLSGRPNQVFAAYHALHRISTLRSSDDFSANKLFDGVKKGLKTVLPVVKGVTELALAFV